MYKKPNHMMAGKNVTGKWMRLNRREATKGGEKKCLGEKMEPARNLGRQHERGMRRGMRTGSMEGGTEDKG